MKKIPRDTANELKERVFQKADEVGYMSLSRNDSQDFMDELVRAEDIGQVIAQFRGNARVRTYIKDAILNRYSKDKAKDARPSNLSTIIKRLFNHDAHAIEENGDIDLYQFTNKSEPHYIVVANGSYLKWETALRKALLYLPGKPFSEDGNVLSIMLTLFCSGSRINNADKKHLKEALSTFNAKVYFYGENM